MRYDRRKSPERSSRRHARKPRQIKRLPSLYHHRLCVESLESRHLLGGTPPFSQMVVFGDSLSDTGNVTGQVASLAGFEQNNGRFTSGPSSTAPSSGTNVYVWNEVLAKQLGINTATPASSGGTNYATGGAETGGGIESGNAWFASEVGLNGSYGLPNIGLQVSNYLTKSPVCPAGTLYTIWGGGNDLVDAANGSRRRSLDASPRSLSTRSSLPQAAP